MRGGADEDVSGVDNMICPQIEAFFGPPWEIVFPPFDRLFRPIAAQTVQPSDLRTE